MKLSFVALCSSVLVKVVAGALSSIGEIDQFKQTIAKFQTTVEDAIGKNDRELLNSILCSPKVTVAERIWYYAKYWETPWQASDALVLFLDINDNIPSVSIADNPEILHHVSLYLKEKVESPTNLAAYDAANILMTLPYLSEFDTVDMENFKAERVKELLDRRRVHGFNPDVIAAAKDINTLQEYVNKKIWRPTKHMVGDAIRRDLGGYLNFLLKNNQVAPSPDTLHLLITKGYSSGLDLIRSFHPAWKPSQIDIDDAVAYGYIRVLEWYAVVDPQMPRPSNSAMRNAQCSGHSEAFKWACERFTIYHGTPLRTSSWMLLATQSDNKC